MKYDVKKDCQITGLNEIYKNLFGYKENGTFIEIGANDGQSFSNKNVHVVHKAISSKDHDLTIYKGGVLSTASKKAYDNFKKISWASNHFKGERETSQAITLQKLLEINKIQPNFDLMIIDVEGFEWEVLKNFKIDQWHPKVVIIELHDNNPNYKHLKDDCDNIVDYFKYHKYKPIYKDQSNTVYTK
jgi:FkbM family methyltransferase